MARKRTTTTTIPSQITALYAESIFTEMERPSITQQSGGASYVNLPLCAVDFSKTQNNKEKSMSYLGEHLSTQDPKNDIYCRSGEDSIGKLSPSLLQFSFISENNDGNDDED